MRPVASHDNEATAIEFSSVQSVAVSKSLHETRSLTHLKTILNRPIRSRESTTPTLESPQYFTVVGCHRTEADGTDIFPNEATAIEFSPSMSRMVLNRWVQVMLYQFDQPIPRQQHDPGPSIRSDRSFRKSTGQQKVGADRKDE
jgi:hypothetical protein